MIIALEFLKEFKKGDTISFIHTSLNPTTLVSFFDIKSVCSIAFLIASILGGIAGFLILSSDTQITPFFGLWATFKGLIAMMIGGMGSLVGAIMGGLVLGVVEANVFWYGDPILRDLSAYMLLFLILIFRPGGLMGNSILQSQDAAKLRV